MLVDPGTSGAGSMVAGAIRQASQATGTSFSYLLATAQVESGLNPHAGASTSSARGLFQFVEQTWLGTIKQSGTSLGYGRYADAITQTASGHYQVKDPAMRRQILALRNDPTANAVMAGAFTKANAAYLTQKLGRQPTDGELYIAHFLGAGGAAKLISQADAAPYASAAGLFPGAAHANPSIFYGKNGIARSVAQVRDVLSGRYNVAAAQPQPSTPVNPLTPPTSIAPVASVQTPAISAPLSLVPDTAGINHALAAATPHSVPQQSQTFHGLFQDGPRNTPVAHAISQLWSAPASSPSAPQSQPPGGPYFNLFTDPKTAS